MWSWDEPWPPWTSSAGDSTWAHSDLAGLPDGRVAMFDKEHRCVLLMGDSGPTESFDVPLGEVHGMAVGGEAEASLWLVDPGFVHAKDGHGGFDIVRHDPRVARFSLEGELLAELERPPGAEVYKPTAIATAPEGGPLWLADGYGGAVVHRYSSSGEHELTIDGTGGLGRFDCPHAVAVLPHRGQPTLWVTDRANSRLQLFDLDGRFIAGLWDPHLDRPSAAAQLGDHVVVADLAGRLLVLDTHGRVVEIVFDGAERPERPGWPNRLLSGEGSVDRPALRARAFNSPHGLAVAGGDVFVTEWVLGGRVVRVGAS